MRSASGFPAVRLFLLGASEARSGSGGPVPGLGNQPKRVALLAYLALAPVGGCRRRDDLLATFFPESDDASARNALNQMLYRLRKSLGDDALPSTDQEVRLDAARVWCDAAAVRDAAAAGDDLGVVDHYRGPLLEAFHARGLSNDFDVWLSQQREDLRDAAVRSAWRLSEAELAAGNTVGAADRARAAVRFAPDREDSVRRLMLLLDGTGDRAGALRAFEEYARRVRAEYEIEPEPELVRLAETIRARPAVDVPLAIEPTVTRAPGRPARSAGPVRRARLPVLATAVVALAWAGPSLTRGGVDAAPVLAVGDIVVGTEAGDVPIELLLSMNLARIEGLSVVTEDRVREVAAQLGSAGRADRSARRAALHAGASEVVEGVLSRRPGGWRLDVRRVDRNGRSSSGHVVEAAELVELVDLVTEQIAGELGLRAPGARREGTTASLVAYRLYQQGLDALYRGDPPGAERLFRAALDEDSTFAMAAYHAALVTARTDREALFGRARALASDAPDRERLLIVAQATAQLLEPQALAVAETLATRYPRDPEAAMIHGRALRLAAREAEAAGEFRRAADLDSLSVHGSELRCRTCEAHQQLRETLLATDSVQAVEREAKAWVARYPASPHAWGELARSLEALERFDEAEEAFERAYGPSRTRDAAHLTGIWIRQLRFEDVDAHWRDEVSTGDDHARRGAYWGQFVSYRTQGRLEEALSAARAYRDLQGDSLLEALALYELGRYREAAFIHEKHAGRWAGARQPVLAVRRAWHLTHAAASYAALGDTARLRQIEDTVRVYGAGSASARHARLHLYVRGLRLRVEGREAEALRAFEASMPSAHYGYVRQPLEVARSRLALGDARGAIEVLRSALRGPVSSTGLYASRTDLMELLGDAYALAGQPDSARAEYGRVLASWVRADPGMRPRVQRVEQALGSLPRE